MAGTAFLNYIERSVSTLMLGFGQDIRNANLRAIKQRTKSSCDAYSID